MILYQRPAQLVLPGVETWSKEYHEWIAASQQRVDDIFALYREEPWWFFYDCVKIPTKAGDLDPLNLDYPAYARAQTRFYDLLMDQFRSNGMMRVVLLKARQWGGSTITAAFLLWLTVIIHTHGRSMVLADDSDGSAGLFDMHKTMYDHLPDWIRPETKYSSRKQIRCQGDHPATGEEVASSIIVGTAQKERTGRKYTLMGIHGSEVAFWGTKAGKVLLGVKAAVPDVWGSLLVLESSANGWGGAFWDAYQKASRNEGGTAAFFVPWHEIDDYSIPSGDHRWGHSAVKGRYWDWVRIWDDEEERNRILDEDERKLVDQFHLTPNQIAWRRWAIEEKSGGDLQGFNQEYPATPEEAFISSGTPVFGPHAIERLRQRVRKPEEGTLVPDLRDGEPERGLRGTHWKWLPLRKGNIMVWEHPRPGRNYVFHIDPAEGVSEKFLERNTQDRDRMAGCMLDANTGDLVAAIFGTISPNETGELAVMLGRYFNTALISVEMNGGFGLPVLEVLQEAEYPSLYMQKIYGTAEAGFTMRYGWTTSQGNRALLFETARVIVRRDEVKIPWEQLVHDMGAMEYQMLASGGVKPVAKAGEHDDTVMAWVTAQRILKEWKEALYQEEAKKRQKEPSRIALHMQRILDEEGESSEGAFLVDF